MTPNLMVVIPDSNHVSLYYGWTPVDYVGWMLTFLGIGLAVRWARRGPVDLDDPRATTAPDDDSDPDGFDPDRPDIEHPDDDLDDAGRPDRRQPVRTGSAAGPTHGRSTARPGPGREPAGTGVRTGRLSPRPRPPPPLTIEDLHGPGEPSARPTPVTPTPVTPTPAGAGWPRSRSGSPSPSDVVMRFVTVAHLWLDEALTVNIARLPLGDIPEALRHDGAPPFYYLLLHGWMAVVGTGDVAVRALSGLLAVASLPLMWLAGRRLARTCGEGTSRWVPWAAVLLLASSPFAIRYATEVRMYSLVVLLVLVGFLAVDTVLERPVPPGLAWRWGRPPGCCCSPTTGRSSWWWRWRPCSRFRWRGADAVGRGGVRRALMAMRLGSLLFLPWLPSFVDQMGDDRHAVGRASRSPGPCSTSSCSSPAATPTPRFRWACSSTPSSLWASSVAPRPGPAGRPAPIGGGIDSTSAAARRDGCWRPSFGLTMALAIVAGQITDAAFAVRYAAVVFPFVLLLAALGTRHVRRHPARSRGAGPRRRARIRHRPPERRRRPHVGGTGGGRPAGRGPPGRRGRLLPRPARTVGQPAAARRGRRVGAAHLPPGRRPRARRLGRLRGASTRRPPPPRSPACSSTGPGPARPSGWCGPPATARFGTKCQDLLTELKRCSGPRSGGSSACRPPTSSGPVSCSIRPP